MKDSDKNNDGRIDFDGEQWPQAKHPCCAPRQGHGLRLLLSCRVPEDDGGCAVKDQTFLRPAAVPSPAPLLSREQQLHSIWPSALAGTLLCSRVPVSSHHRRLSFSSCLSPVALIRAQLKRKGLSCWCRISLGVHGEGAVALCPCSAPQGGNVGGLMPQSSVAEAAQSCGSHGLLGRCQC